MSSKKIVKHIGGPNTVRTDRSPILFKNMEKCFKICEHQSKFDSNMNCAFKRLYEKNDRDYKKHYQAHMHEKWARVRQRASANSKQYSWKEGSIWFLLVLTQV